VTAVFDFSASIGTTIECEHSYWLDEQRIANSFGVELRGRLQDLLSVAMAVYVADRRTQRPPLYRGGWPRQIALRLPVRERDFWLQNHLQNDLLLLLNWLTDDDWAVDFVHRPSVTDSAVQRHLFSDQPVAPFAVALFSGGLDSLAGAASDLGTGSIGELVLVAASSNQPVRDVQFNLVRGLRALGRIRHVNVPLKLVQHAAPGKEERTQRTRGFLHIVLGAAVADLAGSRRLIIYENGVGAINLPYSESQIGVHSSRAVHPKTLLVASRLLSTILGRHFEVELVNFARTKGELCSTMPSAMHPLIKSSVSCDGFPSRITGRPSCGACTSCLLRRQALNVARLTGCEPPGTYLADARVGLVSGRARENLQDMLAQASTIERLSRGADPWRQLVQRYPALLAVDEEDGSLFQDSRRRTVLDLLRRYATEWRAYPSELIPRYFPAA
jgi:7-cyano-7-deazaguanine synthase in queuosine biosynthesis